jgi:hypothetical protein
MWLVSGHLKARHYTFCLFDPSSKSSHSRCKSSKVPPVVSTAAGLTSLSTSQAFPSSQFIATLCPVRVIILAGKPSFLIGTAIQIDSTYWVVAPGRSTKTIRPVAFREIYRSISFDCIDPPCLASVLTHLFLQGIDNLNTFLSRRKALECSRTVEM